MTPLHSKLDAIAWPIHRPMDSPSYVAPLQEWMLYYARRVDAAFALLDVCREWIENDLHKDHCGLRSTTTAITEHGITVTYDGSCTCGRYDLLAKLREVGHE